MKKLKDTIVKIDLGWEFIVPYLACMYLVYYNAEYTNLIILYGWMSCLIHFMLTPLLFKKANGAYAFLFSFVNIIVFLVLFLLGYLSLRGYLIVNLIAEVVATILAFMFFLLFGKEENGPSASESMGSPAVFLILLLFAASIYPFLKEWQYFLLETEATTIYWIQGICILFFATWKKHQAISNLDTKDPNNKDSPKETFLILGSLFLWFVILSALALMN